jgi:outer membrane protein assembly factor BamB
LVGATDGNLATALVKAEPLLVYTLAPDAATEARLRQTFVAAGIHGQATAGGIGSDGTLPLNDDVTAMAIADLDVNKGLKREEILRIVRPFGKAHIKENGQWQTVDKPRPEDMDDWPQYFHDAAMSDLSTDKRAGPARGLQWETGPQTVHSNGVRVVGDVVIGQDEQGLWARDAFSGLPCWRRSDLKAATRYSLLADGERVYIYPSGQPGYPPTPSPCQLALDLRTGETVLKYTEGLTFEVPPKDKKDPKAAKEEHQAVYDRAKDFQARLIDGLLIQVSGPGLAVLDAKTGKRLWGTDAPGDAAWAHPLAAGNTLYVVQGPSAPSASYTHWPMTLVQKVMAFDLKTGKTQWVWEWQKEMPAVYAAMDATGEKTGKQEKVAPAAERVAAAYNMALDGDRLVFALRAELATTWRGAGLVRQLALEAKSGKFIAYGRTPGNGGGRNIQMGGGHSHFRVLPVNGRWWFPDAIGIYGYTDPTAPTDASKFQLTYAKLPRPVGCTVFRASPNFLFGSLTTYALDGSGIQHTNVARAACDVGAFPANGMTYITPNHCFCQPYLPGHNVFHPRAPKAPDEAGRLERGTAVPAAALPAADDEWPVYLRDGLRSSWTGARIPAALRQAWTIRPAEPLAGLIGQDWANQWHGQGPVTGVSIVEGIGVLALTDRQQVIALDPATGKTKWQAAVDGRIDSQPTVFNGAVYVGTRAGWLYALNRDSGDLIWRFRAAPRRERIVVNGQLESVWPLFGTVTADSEGVWAVAGRHNECDGGLWWWRLDPATGAVRASGRFGRDELRTTTGATGAVDSDAAWPNGANCPPVTNGKLFLMARVHCKREDGKLTPWNYWSSKQKPGEEGLWESNYNTGILVPGNQGLLNRIDFLGGYKMCAFGYVQARQFAYRDSDFLTVGGTKGTLQHRGGDGGSSVSAFKRRPALGEITVTNPKEPDKPRKMTAGSELRWENPMELARRGDGTKALAVAGDSVLVGVSVTDGDRWKEREKMPHRLQVLSLADGKLQQEFPLPATPIPGGLSAAKGRVYVTTIDGSVTCFDAAK